MSAFSQIVTTWGGHCLRFSGMLILFAEIYIMIEAIRIKRGAPFIVFACVQSVVGLLFFSVLLDGTLHETYLPFERTYPFLVNAVYGAPWICTALILLAMSLLAAASLISNGVFKRTRVSGDAVKQTVDLLPEGICFGNEEGTAVFFNVKMDDWCLALTGKPLKSAGLLRDFVLEHGEERGESRIVQTEAGTVLLFSFGNIEAADKTYLQISAIDVTEQYRITSDLRQKQASLMDIRRRMKQFSESAAELAMEEELLKARVTVHDELGHVLLNIKYHLDRPDTMNEGKLIAMIRTVNDLLISDAEDDGAGSGESALYSVEDAVEAAGSIGVRTELTGELPEDAGFRAILACAIRECAVNTVKHAGGTLLTVRLETLPDCAKAVLTNDGAPPSERIQEAGGLASLRTMVENAGGAMTVGSSPEFSLIIVFPENK